LEAGWRADWTTPSNVSLISLLKSKTLLEENQS